MAEELSELPALSELVCKKILPIKPVHKKPPFPEVPLITTIAVALLLGCASEPDYSGSYILTLGGGSVRFELKPDGSFIGSPEGEDKDAVGTW